MSVNGVPFLGFLCVCVPLYYLAPKRLRWTVLLAASALFYLSHGYRAALYLAGTIALTFLAALRLDGLSRRRADTEDREARKRARARLERR
ncbi:MAG: hypothetical protein IJU66_00815, partial [Oscillospiraceae bacterium]|nr:hypothetical protein [Oscillospiraceae bacterium]